MPTHWFLSRALTRSSCEEDMQKRVDVGTSRKRLVFCVKLLTGLDISPLRTTTPRRLEGRRHSTKQAPRWRRRRRRKFRIYAKNASVRPIRLTLPPFCARPTFLLLSSSYTLVSLQDESDGRSRRRRRFEAVYRKIPANR